MRRRPSLAGKSVMVTGGAGFVGSHLSDRLMKEKPSKLVIVDNFSLGKRRNIKSLESQGEVRVYRKDATRMKALDAVVGEEKVDVVFNLAVIPLPMSLELPLETIMTNVAITANVCELQRKGGFKTLVHCSSSEAYGSALYVPMDEEHPHKPLTPYAASKIACDEVAISFYRTFGLDISVARPFNTYGPRQNARSYAGVIPVTIERLMRKEAPIVFGDGHQTRDYTYVSDIVDGILGVYYCEETRGRIVNLASGKEVSIISLIKLIAKTMGYRGEIVHQPARPGDVLRHRGDISLAKRLFGYAPRTSFEEGMERTVDWYLRELKSP